MRFNPSKCEHITFYNKQTTIKYDYRIQDNLIKSVDSIKYLGVTIDRKVTWTEHTDRIVLKANRVHGFLYRNFKMCSINIKAKLYKTSIQPILKYASTVWSPYHVKNIVKVESVQRLMAHFNFNNYSWQCSITNLLKKLSWPTLYERRLYNHTITLFKIIHNQIDIPIRTSIFTPNSVNTRGNTSKFIQLQTWINCYTHSFFPEAIRLWNSLPESLISCDKIETFKKNDF